MMVHVPLMFLSEWLYFLCRLALRGGGGNPDDSSRLHIVEKARVADMLPFSLCNKKILAIRHPNRPLFPTTLSILRLREREVGRANDLSAPRPNSFASSQSQTYRTKKVT